MKGLKQLCLLTALPQCSPSVILLSRRLLQLQYIYPAFAMLAILHLIYSCQHFSSLLINLFKAVILTGHLTACVLLQLPHCHQGIYSYT